MKAISSVEVAHLVQEFKSLEGARIDKVYQSNDQFFIVAKKSGEKKQMLAIILPYAAFFSTVKPEMGIPSAFCSKLRNHLERSIITSVKQCNTERIIELMCNTKEGDKRIFIELFSKGNLIICDAQKKIILPFKSQTWKDRILKRGQTYQLPPARTTPLNTSKEEWVNNLLNQEFKSIAAYLATQGGLGGKHATSLCESFLVNPKATSVTKEQAQKLFEGFKQLYTCPDRDKLSPQLQKEWEPSIQKEAPQDKKKLKILSILEQQEQAIERLKNEADINNKKAEQIYSHYQEIKELLAKAKQTRDLKELKSIPIIKSVDPKNKTITIDFEQ